MDHDTYNTHLLANVLLNSITDDLTTTLLNCIHICNDGTYILWCICHNIDHNNMVFVAHEKNGLCLHAFELHIFHHSYYPFIDHKYI
jgi:hypothetical protein